MAINAVEQISKAISDFPIRVRVLQYVGAHFQLTLAKFSGRITRSTPVDSPDETIMGDSDNLISKGLRMRLSKSLEDAIIINDSATRAALNPSCDIYLNLGTNEYAHR